MVLQSLDLQGCSSIGFESPHPRPIAVCLVMNVAAPLRNDSGLKVPLFPYYLVTGIRLKSNRTVVLDRLDILCSFTIYVKIVRKKIISDKY